VLYLVEMKACLLHGQEVGVGGGSAIVVTLITLAILIAVG
jgi:hypothetical protein